jgi:hypothetical protein
MTPDLPLQIQTPLEWVLLVSTVISGLVSFFLGKRGRNIETTVREGLEKNLPEVLADYERVKKAHLEIHARIEGILKERDGWRELYNDQAAGHDNAQALMMNTISNLAKSYQAATGKTPKLDPLIEVVRTDFVGKHGPAPREKLLLDTRPKADKESPDVAKDS